MPGKEENTRYTERIHIKHLLRLLGRRTLVGAVTHKKLQAYADIRAQEKGRSGNPLSHVTIKKELGTLSSIWNKWALPNGQVPAALLTRGLQYDKLREKPPFQTWDQVMRKTKGDAASGLWDSVFLSVAQIEELLGHVCQHKSRWFHPMFVFCAYTGARRSEMLRARVEDVDLERGQVTIREKKKDHTRKETYRHVPLAPELRESLRDWLKVHPGGEILFCKAAGELLSDQMANHYFRRALKGSKWQVLRGWHMFRHSFISNLASRGVSDHVIMALVGHLNAETTRRYLHLRPDTLEAAMGAVFGQRPLVVADSS